MVVAVNEVVKHPKIISDANEIIYIEDKRKNQLKSIVIPAKYKSFLNDKLKEIEYQMWLDRNKGLFSDSHSKILDNVIEDIGDKL